MYTFGYSNRLGGPARALIAMAIGAVMVIYNGEALGLVVKIIAALLLASGVVSLAVALKKSKDGSSRLMLFNAVVDVVIAFLLFTFSVEVGNLIIYLIGFVLFGFGIFQLIAEPFFSAFNDGFIETAFVYQLHRIFLAFVCLIDDCDGCCTGQERTD